MSHRVLGAQWRSPQLSKKGSFAWTAPFDNTPTHVVGVSLEPLSSVMGLHSSDYPDTVGESLPEVRWQDRNNALGSLTRSISQNGVTKPVDVFDGWKVRSEGRVESVSALTDGHHRVAVADELGLPDIPVRRLTRTKNTDALGQVLKGRT